MTNTMRDKLGIAQRNKKHEPSPIPGQPFVKVEDVNGRQVAISIQQSKTNKVKPKGVIGANIMIAYGDEAPATAAGWQFAVATGRSKLVLTLDEISAPCTAWITAFWMNGRKQTGQAGVPVSVKLAEAPALPVGMKLKKAA
jgi:hypothetical protein